MGENDCYHVMRDLPLPAWRSEIKNYYNDITHNNLDLIKMLKDDVAKMRQGEAQKDKKMAEIKAVSREKSVGQGGGGVGLLRRLQMRYPAVRCTCGAWVDSE